IGLVAGTKLADPIGTRGLLLITAVGYPLAALLATRGRHPLRPPRPEGSISEHLSRVGRDLVLGARRLVATPVAIGSIVSVSLAQFLIGWVTVLSVVVFNERFKEGVGSYGNIVAAGGLGVLAGTM